MTSRTRRKNSRQRGSHTHGWGSKKKHRGAGNRGGRGMAGTGKRGDCKKPRVWSKKKYFGKFGFKKKNIKAKINAITIKSVEQMLPLWVGKKLAEEKAGAFEVSLEKLGYNKLLSNGKATKKMKITVSYASASAAEKVKAAGGEVVGIAGNQAPAKEQAPAKTAEAEPKKE